MERSSSIAVALLLGLAASGLTARAGLDAWGETPNRIGFNMRGVFNVKASFSQLGGAPPATDIGMAVGGVDHFYDDGYNRVDSSGNAGDSTWFWGYDRQSQADGAGIQMSSSAAQPTGRVEEVTDDPHWGGELFYWRELGWNNSYAWGLVAGLGWQYLRFNQSATFGTDVTRTTDTYSLFGQPPPPAPYRGQFDSSTGPLLSDIPNRQTSLIPNGALTSGQYEFEASAYTLRLGLLFETPFTDWLDLQFGGGVLASVINGEFAFRETTVVGDLPAPPESDSDRSTEFVGGGYAELNLSLRVAKRVYVIAGAQYQMLTDYSQEMAGRKVELDARSSVVALLGMNYAF
jgi:hypothetical protein